MISLFPSYSDLFTGLVLTMRGDRDSVQRVVQRISLQRFVYKAASHTILVVMFSIYALVTNILYAQQKLHDDLFSISFPTESEGWACGRWGTVLRTADGGKTWMPQASGTDYTLSSIFFVDPQHGWSVGDEGIIIHTENGGETWEIQNSPVPFLLMDVYFANRLKGWIVTERTHILSTDDGGKTWSIQFRDQDFILKAVSFCDPHHGWAVGEYGYIYHTSNGGIAWEKQAGSFDISESTGEVVGGIFLFDVVAVDPQTAWAVGIDGYVVKTVDSGETWQEVKTGAPKTQLFCIASDKKGTILIGGNGTFFSSSDRGETWQTPDFKPPITYGWIYGIASRASSGFVAVGWEGAIYLSNSTSWLQVNN